MWGFSLTGKTLGELTEKYDASNINDYYAAISDLRRELVNYLSLEEKNLKL